MLASEMVKISKFNEEEKMVKKAAKLKKQIEIMENHIKDCAETGDYMAAFHDDMPALEMASYFRNLGYVFNSNRSVAHGGISYTETYYYLSWEHLK